MDKRLHKSNDRILTGVLGGIAEYYNLEPSILRICYAALTLFTVCFPGIILYIIMALVIPKRDKHLQ